MSRISFQEVSALMLTGVMAGSIAGIVGEYFAQKCLVPISGRLIHKIFSPDSEEKNIEKANKKASALVGALLAAMVFGTYVYELGQHIYYKTSPSDFVSVTRIFYHFLPEEVSSC